MDYSEKFKNLLNSVQNKALQNSKNNIKKENTQQGESQKEMLSSDEKKFNNNELKKDDLYGGMIVHNEENTPQKTNKQNLNNKFQPQKKDDSASQNKDVLNNSQNSSKQIENKSSKTTQSNKLNNLLKNIQYNVNVNKTNTSSNKADNNNSKINTNQNSNNNTSKSNPQISTNLNRLLHNIQTKTINIYAAQAASTTKQSEKTTEEKQVLQNENTISEKFSQQITEEFVEEKINHYEISDNNIKEENKQENQKAAQESLIDEKEAEQDQTSNETKNDVSDEKTRVQNTNLQATLKDDAYAKGAQETQSQQNNADSEDGHGDNQEEQNENNSSNDNNQNEQNQQGDESKIVADEEVIAEGQNNKDEVILSFTGLFSSRAAKLIKDGLSNFVFDNDNKLSQFTLNVMGTESVMNVAYNDNNEPVAVYNYERYGENYSYIQQLTSEDITPFVIENKDLFKNVIYVATVEEPDTNAFVIYNSDEITFTATGDGDFENNIQFSENSIVIEASNVNITINRVSNPNTKITVNGENCTVYNQDGSLYVNKSAYETDDDGYDEYGYNRYGYDIDGNLRPANTLLTSADGLYSARWYENGIKAFERIKNDEKTCTEISYNEAGVKISEDFYTSDGTSNGASYNDNGMKTSEFIANPDGTYSEASYNDKGVKTYEYIVNPDGTSNEARYNDEGMKTYECISTADSLIKRTEWNDEGTTAWTINSDGSGQRTIHDKDGYLVSEFIYNKNGSSTETFYNKDKIQTSKKITNINGSSEEEFLREDGTVYKVICYDRYGNPENEDLYLKCGEHYSETEIKENISYLYTPTFDEDGYDKDGYNYAGINSDGYNRAGVNTNNYDKFGLDENGLQYNGYDLDGYDINGYDKFGNYRSEKVEEIGTDSTVTPKLNISNFDGVAKLESLDLRPFDSTHLSREDFDIQGEEEIGGQTFEYGISKVDGKTYYFVDTADKLQAINSATSKNFVLMGDIDLEGWDTGDGTGWKPIDSFYGIFDGNGFVVSNLKINSTGRWKGLFGNAKGTIKNVGIKNAEVQGSYDIGSLVGTLRGGSVYNCYAENVTVTGIGTNRPATGGLIGSIGCGYGGNIDSCYVINSNVSGPENVGGLLGYLGYFVGMSNCYAVSTSVKGNTGNLIDIGGLIGFVDDSNVTNCLVFVDDLNDIDGNSDIYSFAHVVNSQKWRIENCQAILNAENKEVKERLNTEIKLDNIEQGNVEVDGKLYHNGVAYTGFINDRYFIDGEPINGIYYNYNDSFGSIIKMSKDNNPIDLGGLELICSGCAEYKDGYKVQNNHSSFMIFDVDTIKDEEYDNYGILSSFIAKNTEYDTDFEYTIEYSDYGYSVTAKSLDENIQGSYTIDYMETEYNTNYPYSDDKFKVVNSLDETGSGSISALARTITKYNDVTVTKVNYEKTINEENEIIMKDLERTYNKYTKIEAENGTTIVSYYEDMQFNGSYIYLGDREINFYNGEQVVIDKEGNYKVTDKNGNIFVYDINGNKYEGFFGAQEIKRYDNGRFVPAILNINGQVYNNLLEIEDLEYYIDGKPATASTEIEGKTLYFKDSKLLNGAYTYNNELIYCQKGLKTTGHIDNEDGTKTYFVNGLLANGVTEGLLCKDGKIYTGIDRNINSKFLSIFDENYEAAFSDFVSLYNNTTDENLKDVLSYFVNGNSQTILFKYIDSSNESNNKVSIADIVNCLGTTELNNKTLDNLMKKACYEYTVKNMPVEGSIFKYRDGKTYVIYTDKLNKYREYLSTNERERNYIKKFLRYDNREAVIRLVGFDSITITEVLKDNWKDIDPDYENTTLSEPLDMQNGSITLNYSDVYFQVMYKDGVIADDIFIDDTLYYKGIPAIGYNIHEDKLYKDSTLYTGEYYDAEEYKEFTYNMGEKLNGEYVIIKENGAIVEIREPQEGEEGLLYKDGLIVNNELVNEVLYKNGKVAQGYNVYNEQMFYNGTRFTGNHGATYLEGNELNGEYVIEYDEENNKITNIRVPNDGEECLLYRGGYLVNNEVIDGKLYVAGKVAQGMSYDGGLAYYNGALANGNVFDILYKDGIQLNGYYTVETDDDDNLIMTEAEETDVNSKLYIDGKIVDKQIIDNIYYEDGRIAKGYDLVDDTMFFNGRIYTGEANDEGIYIYGKAINGYYIVTKDEDDDVESIKISDAENGTYYKDGKVSDPVETIISIKDYVEFKNGIWTDNAIIDGVTVDGVVAYGYLYVNGQVGGTAIVNDRYYVDGKLSIGNVQVDGVQFYNGRKLNGFIDDKYYADGVLANGTYLGVLFVEGEFYTGEKDGVQYIDGYVADGYYDGIVWTDGHLANGEVDGVIYEKGEPINKKWTDGKMYIDGELAYGVASDGKYYTEGVLSDGVDAYGIVYVGGNRANKVIDGILYSDGKPMTGVKSGVMYKDGIPANGAVNGVLYENGYKSNTAETTVDGVLYKNGSAYNGTIENKLYVNGVLANGNVGEKFYINGVESVRPAVQENYVNSDGLYIISYPDLSTLNISEENITYTENDDGTITKTYDLLSEDGLSGRSISQIFDGNGQIYATSVDDYNYDMTTGKSTYYTTIFDENNKCNFRYANITEMQSDGNMKMTMVTDPDGTLTKVEKSSEIIELTASGSDFLYSARTNDSYAAKSIIETSLSKINLARWKYNTSTSLLSSDPNYRMGINNNGGEVIWYLDDAYSYISSISSVVWSDSSTVSFSGNSIEISTENTKYSIYFDNKNQITHVNSTKHTDNQNEEYCNINLTYDSNGNVSSMSYKKSSKNDYNSSSSQQEILFTATLKNSVVQSATLAEIKDNTFKNTSSNGRNSYSKYIEIGADMNITEYKTEECHAKYWDDGDVYTYSRDKSLEGNVLTEEYKSSDKTRYSTDTTTETAHYSVSPSVFYVSEKVVNGVTKTFPQQVLTDSTRVYEHNYRNNDSYTNSTETITRKIKKDESYYEKVTYNGKWGNKSHNSTYSYESISDGHDSYSYSGSSKTNYTDGVSYNHSSTSYSNYRTGKGDNSWSCTWSSPTSGTSSDSNSYSYDCGITSYKAPEIPVTSISSVDISKLYKNPEVERIPDTKNLKHPSEMTERARMNEATKILEYCVQRNKTKEGNYTFYNVQDYSVDKEGKVTIENCSVESLLTLRRWLTINDINSDYLDGSVGTFTQQSFGDCEYLSSINTLTNLKSLINKTSDGYLVTLPGNFTSRDGSTIIEKGPFNILITYEEAYRYNKRDNRSAGDFDVYLMECAIINFLEQNREKATFSDKMAYMIGNTNGSKVQAYNLLYTNNTYKSIELYDLFGSFSNKLYQFLQVLTVGGTGAFKSVAGSAVSAIAAIKAIAAFVAGAAGVAIGNLFNRYDIADLISGNISVYELVKRKEEDIKILFNSDEMKMKILKEFLPVLVNQTAGTGNSSNIKISDDIAKKYHVSICQSEKGGDGDVIRYHISGNPEYTEINCQHSYKIVSANNNFITIVNPHYSNTTIKVPTDLFSQIFAITVMNTDIVL